MKNTKTKHCGRNKPMDYIIAFSILVGLAIVNLIIMFWYDNFGNPYARAMNKAIKDMEKGITTVITDEEDGSFTVKKYKDEEKS